MTKVDTYISQQQVWQNELILLRRMLLQSNLREGWKWNRPIYMIGEKNVIGMSSFKKYVGLWFFQGALLADNHKMLINAQDGKTKMMRQWRFHYLEEITSNKAIIKAYIEEAVKKHGDSNSTIIQAKKKSLEIPMILQNALQQDNHLTAAFNSFSKSKQREFMEYIAEAKRETTKEKRLVKIIAMILRNEGLHDRYRK